MAEPFKNLLNPEAIGRLATALERARPGWDAAAFTATATAGLDGLELKDRVRHVAAALHQHLDPDFASAVGHVLDSLPPPLSSTDGVTAGMELWPLCHWVQEQGPPHPDVALPALYELTRRFSAEFAIRPFIEQDQDRVLALLARWADDPDPHVRRLVSEGTRPRLPWGRRLRGLQADPTPGIALLDRLVDDPELYVRRSVANHLNDISKDHPDTAVEVATRWLARPTKEREWVVKHALRSLIKAGHPGALAALGFGEPAVELLSFTRTPQMLVFPGVLELALVLLSTAETDQALVIDYAIHHRTARGKLSPKVYKWSTRTLAAGATLELGKKHKVVPISTRRFHAGTHRVEVLVNGRSLGVWDWELVLS